MKTPFKFLDSYSKEDADIFFGREREIVVLSDLISSSKFILVYGQSGLGKTSIVQCGLTKYFDDSNSIRFFIRKGSNINQALESNLRSELNSQLKNDSNFDYLVSDIFFHTGKPVYLIFDQFEELFILGSEEEIEKFIFNIKPLLHPDLPVKIIVVLREEYLSHLYIVEKEIPGIFDNRLRIEAMSADSAKDMLLDVARAREDDFRFESEKVVERIIGEVSNSLGKVNLPQLQIALENLYNAAVEKNNSYPVIDMELVNNIGIDLENILNNFFVEQISEIENREGISENLALQFLAPFVTLKGTRRVTTIEELKTHWRGIDKKKIQILQSFFIQNRILRQIDSNQLEITHDSIAKIIDSKMTSIEKFRRHLLKKINFYYEDFQETGEYISKKQLKYLEPHLSDLPLTNEVLNFVKQSIEKRKSWF